MRQFAARVDRNQEEIITALQRTGWAVERIRQPTDLLIAKAGRMLLCEVKDGPKAKLRPSQQRIIARGFPVIVIRSLDDVERLNQVR